MTVTEVNLIPIARRAADRRRTRLRWWLGAVTIYAVLLVPMVFVVRTRWAAADPSIAMDWERTAAAVDQARADTEQLRAELGAISTQVNASQIVGTQPDWSVLLAVIASMLGEDIVLSGCDLVRYGDATTAGTPGRPGTRSAAEPPPVATEFGLKIELTGHGRSQQAVSRFVLRLEQHSLFQAVKLLDTRRESFLKRESVAFRIESVLVAPGSRGAASP